MYKNTKLAKRAAEQPSREYMNALRFERGIIATRKNEAEYFKAGQGVRRKHKPGKASAKTQAYYGYYFDTLRID